LLDLGTATVTQGYIKLRSTGSGAREANIYSPAGGGLTIDTNSYSFPVTIQADTIQFGTGPSGTERARIDSSGRLLVGTSTSVNVGTIVGTTQQIAGSGQPLSLRRFSNSAVGPNILFGKTRATVDADYTIVQDGDTLGGLIFAGADGVDLETPGATIVAQVDGTPGANDMPGRLVFSTTSDSASSPTERLRINNAGAVGLAGANFGSAGQVLTSNGANSPPTWTSTPSIGLVLALS
jgi:hypothetical protein